MLHNIIIPIVYDHFWSRAYIGGCLPLVQVIVPPPPITCILNQIIPRYSKKYTFIHRSKGELMVSICGLNSENRSDPSSFYQSRGSFISFSTYRHHERIALWYTSTPTTPWNSQSRSKQGLNWWPLDLPFKKITTKLWGTATVIEAQC